MRRFLCGLLCAASVLGVLALARPARAVPSATIDSEVLIAELQRVVATGRMRGALDETTIVGLRTLSDERLAPLFAALADAPRWEARVHGVLGLAEVDPSRRVNTLVVSELKDPQVRAVVVGEALKQNLIEAADLRELVAISDLEPPLRLVLLSKLRNMGGTVTPEEVEAVVAEIPAESVGMRVYGSLVAADLRGEDGSAVWPQIEGVRIEAAREAILAIVLRQIREEPLTKVTGFVEKAWEWGRGRTLLESDVVVAMVAQSPERGEAAWGELWADSPDLSRRILLGALLLEFAPVVSAESFQKLVSDPDPCVQKMGAMGAAVAGGGPFGDELFALLAQDHRISTGAALTSLAAMPGERRLEASRRVVERVLERSEKAAVPRYGFEISRLLAKEDVASIKTLLDRAVAAEDWAAAQMLLTAVLEQDPVRPWEPGATPELTDRRARVLASLIEARASLGAGLNEGQMEDLRRIAAGREMLPPAMRVQAAWLALCAAGQEREALARIMAPDAPAKPAPPAGD